MIMCLNYQRISNILSTKLILLPSGSVESLKSFREAYREAYRSFLATDFFPKKTI
jgi:hypothetical protein